MKLLTDSLIHTAVEIFLKDAFDIELGEITVETDEFGVAYWIFKKGEELPIQRILAVKRFPSSDNSTIIELIEGILEQLKFDIEVTQ